MLHSIITLKKGKEISVLRKHPWVFSGAISTVDNGVKDGTIVEIVSWDKSFLAMGHYQSVSSIAVRIISFEPTPIDLNFWKLKISAAIQYRKAVSLPNQKTNCYRLIHGEGDGLPGLIIDIYHDIAVIQCHSAGMYLAAQDIASSISACMPEQIRHIYLRAKDTLPDSLKTDINDHFILGNKNETTVKENGVNFKVNVESGQKTGFFLDQRENRSLVGSVSEGKSVLNCFCYTGGFSLFALMGGAQQVDSIDISQKAVDLMEENVLLNQFAGKHNSYCENVMTYLTTPNNVEYDIVIVDPPAFAKSLHKRHNAVQAYKRLNSLALKKVKPGGMLFTFSCSQVVGTQLFYDTIVAAGMESGRNIRVAKSLSQGPDHPIGLFHPEGHYLKGLQLFVD
ncbi:MAG: class I SAM-dependent rRNA methyltransferase [Saprospiraceae bacterium]